MEKINLSIPAISCKHCVMTIKNELSEINGVSTVEGDPEKKEITVEWDNPATLKEIKTVLDEINYPAVE
jgi:copper chaperone